MTVAIPSIQIAFSPLSFAALRIKDGSYNFHEENTEHSLANITPARQASHHQTHVSGRRFHFAVILFEELEVNLN